MKKVDLVLLVDDDDVSNFISNVTIANSNQVKEVVTKTNGLEAARYLEDCDNTFPDLVLLDINMPLMNGFELLDHYSQSNYSGRTKFVILSTSTHKDDKEKALTFSDVIGYIEKPLTSEGISEILKSL